MVYIDNDIDIEEANKNIIDKFREYSKEYNKIEINKYSYSIDEYKKLINDLNEKYKDVIKEQFKKNSYTVSQFIKCGYGDPIFEEYKSELYDNHDYQEYKCLSKNKVHNHKSKKNKRKRK